MARLRLVVKTGSKIDSIEKFDSYWVIHVKQLPEKGKANQAVLKLISKEVKKPVKLVSGLKSKNKVVEIIS